MKNKKPFWNDKAVGREKKQDPIRSGRAWDPGPSHMDRREEARARPVRERADPPGSKKVPPPARRTYKLIEGIDPFLLFCAYHLGITRDDNYRPQNIHDVARRFNTTPDRIKMALLEYELDPETILNTDFDMSLAQLDMKVAPKGISRIELARVLYEDFRSAPRIIRNWKEELERDAEENAKIFTKLR